MENTNDIYFGGMLCVQDDTHFLKHFSSFVTHKPAMLSFTYQEASHPELLCLKQAFHLEDIAGVGTDFEKQKRLTKWVFEQLLSGGAARPPYPFNARNIIEKTYTKKINSNCWMYATVLNEIFLSMGYDSRMLRCMPMDLRFNECHCVTTLYSYDYNKWIVFDAAMGYVVYMNKSGKPMSSMEIREALIEGNPIYDYNEREINRTLLGFLFKNMFRFQCYSESLCGIESKQMDKTVYNLNPVGYTITDKNIAYKYKKNQLFLKNTSNAESFWVPPMSKGDSDGKI